MVQRYWFLVGALMIFISGCASTPDKDPVKPLYQININNIEEALRSGNIVRAMQDYFLLQEKMKAENGSVEREMREKVEGNLKEEFRSALDDHDYDTALRLFVSAEQAGWDKVLESSYSELKRKQILHMLENGNPVRSLALARQLDSFSLFEAEELQLLLSASIEEEKYTTAGIIIQEIKDRDIEPEQELPDESADKYTRSQLVRGTVTIWVNRGMRIEEGVGLPDRVIGSGFYIDRRGYIITNYHVIRSQVDPKYEGYSRLYIRPSENPEVKIPARVVGYDNVFDIALLKVETESENVLSFSPVKKQKSGEQIYAIGSPGGLENTITSGIVSSTDRRFLQMGSVVQVDVPINQGNSGGPLLDGDGNLIGVVFAGIEQFEGVNFAIPVQWVMHIFPKLYEEGRISHPFLGVSLYKTDEGLEVTYVLPGSPAHRIGLKAGDILQDLGGTEIETLTEAHDVILSYSPETLVKVKWLRGSESYSGLISLNSRPLIPLERALEYDEPEHLFAPAFGMQVEKIQDNLLGTKYLVKKVYRGSVADETGLSVNDPFSLQQWRYLEERKIVIAQIRIKKRKAGFLETGVQLGAYVETNYFL